MELISNIVCESEVATRSSGKIAREQLVAKLSRERGAVFTRPEVVDFILDLVGYTEDKPLHKMRLLEPAFGGGDFLFSVIMRLLAAWRATKKTDAAIEDLRNSIRAIELDDETFHLTHCAVVELLKNEGIDTRLAMDLANHWLLKGNFLLEPLYDQFHYVVGNPPYVRQELITASLLAEYRKRYHTFYDRADLYIPFIERSLSMLRNKGCLGFICSDRWMKNRYGGPLRKFIAEQFHLKIYVDMVDTPAFKSDVIAYPAITIIANEKPGKTRIAFRPSIDRNTLAILSNTLQDTTLSKNCKQVEEITPVAHAAEPWLLKPSEQTQLIRRLEEKFPTLEEVGCKIGIGVATGADKAFIGDFDLLDVEDDRKLPLATTHDILSGEVKWQGLGVINPFLNEGGLVDLRDYPRLRCFLEDRYEILARRHCVKKSPNNWYRTIDRINPELMKKTKLLIPDIKEKANVVLEKGLLYPHHNLYYVTAEDWDLRALQAVLLSAVARFFVANYSTKMRGGFLRFQAQYLRRIRIPYWVDVPTTIKEDLIKAALKRDIQACNYAVFELYGLNYKEQNIVKDNGE